ncbi:MAG: hypothetical protein ACOCVH_02160 [Verrucomicrobiota bacterium]
MNQHDLRINSREWLDISTDVKEELLQAQYQFPAWPDDIIHGVAIMAEESGETVQAALLHTYEDGALDNVEKEAIQTAAMAIRLVTDIRRRREECEGDK